MSITVKSGLDGHKLGYPKHRKTGKFTVPEKSAVWAYTPKNMLRGSQGLPEASKAVLAGGFIAFCGSCLRIDLRGFKTRGWMGLLGRSRRSWQPASRSTAQGKGFTAQRPLRWDGIRLGSPQETGVPDRAALIAAWEGAEGG